MFETGRQDGLQEKHQVLAMKIHLCAADFTISRLGHDADSVATYYDYHPMFGAELEHDSEAQDKWLSC